jgi:WD40 repeat protein
VVFELAKNYREPGYRIQKDTLLPAGKDAKGANVFYGTDTELVLNRTAIDPKQGLKSIFIEKGLSKKAPLIKSIHAAEDADTADGRGAPLEDPDGKWLTFGGSKMPYGRVGFAIASPMFLLAEGTRTILVTWYAASIEAFLAGERTENVQEELAHNIKVQASGEKKWIDLNVEGVAIDERDASVTFTLTLGAKKPPVVGFSRKLLGDGYETDLPVVRFLFNSEGIAAKSDPSRGKDIQTFSDDVPYYPHNSIVRREGRLYKATLGITKPGFRPEKYPRFWNRIERSYPYKYFRQMELRALKIEVDVQGVRNLILENDFGSLNPAKPFYPFGPVPRANGRFMIGSREAFGKKLQGITLQLDWADLPQENFSIHYANYLSGKQPRNDYFTANIGILSDGQRVRPVAIAPIVLTSENASSGPVAFTQDGRVAVAATEKSDGRWDIGAWDAISGHLIWRIERAHSNRIILAGLDQEEDLITLSTRGSLRKWDAKTGKLIQSHENIIEGRIINAAFYEDGSQFAAVTERALAVWKTGDIEKPIIFRWKQGVIEPKPEESVMPLAFSTDGKLLVTAIDKTVIAFRTGGELKPAFTLSEESSVTALLLVDAPNMYFLVTGSTILKVWAWDGKEQQLGGKGKEISAFGETDWGGIRYLACSSKRKLVSAAFKNGNAFVWTQPKSREIPKEVQLKDQVRGVRCIGFDPLGDHVFTGAEDGSLCLWDSSSGKLKRAQKGHSPVVGATFHPMERLVLIAKQNGEVSLWEAQDPQEFPLFSPPVSERPPAGSRTLSPEFDWDDLSRDLSPEPHSVREPTHSSRSLYLSLNQDFLHGVYPRLLAESAKNEAAPVPNAPYTPLIASLSLDYKAAEHNDFSVLDKSSFNQRVERIYQLGPFGHREIYPIRDDSTAADIPICRRLVPEFTVSLKQSDGTTRPVDAEGTLCIGLSGLKPPQNLSLLFQVAEGSEDPTVSPPDVVWSHLDGDRWIDFTTSEVVSDSTSGLLTSGIIKFSMPRSMTDANTSMPAGLHWIKASVAENSAGIPQLIAVLPQAVTASFRDHGNDPSRLRVPLPGETISKLRDRAAAVKTVAQPYASFGGIMPETNPSFYTRVSERLRHKRRAFTIFDYERLVLREFPEVYKVKCLNHAGMTGMDPVPECAPGHVRILVIPNLRNRNAVDPLHPRLSLHKLRQIARYLEEIASDFVSIHVTNPEYQDVRARFNVRFRPGMDKGFYTNQLNRDIIRFLSPWLHDEAADLAIGGRIHRSAILNWIEEREYVDFVTSFQIDHILTDRTLVDVEEAKATNSAAALVSAGQHTILDNIVSCEDEPKPAPLPPAPPEVEVGPVVVPPGFERYLGNAREGEMHDLLNVKPQCQIDEIRHRAYFTDVQDGLKLKYDYCAYCFSRDQSKR